MYNRYIPDDTEYIPAGGAEHSIRPGSEGTRGGAPRPAHSQGGSDGIGLSALLGGKEGILSLLTRPSGGKGLTSALKGLKLGDWDSGDLLLLLIVLLLLTEGDDLELIIALGLALMMGLGEAKEKQDSGA